MKNKILKILSVILILFVLFIPMYSIFPNGLIPNKDAWFLTETLKVFMEQGLGAFNYIGAVFHLAVLIPGILLCIGTFLKKEIMVRVSATVGTILLLFGLVLAVAVTGEITLLNPINGYICIGYWLDLIILVMCIIISLKNSTRNKRKL